MSRGYCGIGIFGPKNSMNMGTLWRSALLLDASYIFTIGQRYKKQPSDVYASARHMPLFTYQSFDEFYGRLPYNCRLVGIELDDRATEIRQYKHPERAVYLLGAEDHGLPPSVISRCHDIIRLPGERSMNVATAGSIVLFDRNQKEAG